MGIALGSFSFVHMIFSLLEISGLNCSGALSYLAHLIIGYATCERIILKRAPGTQILVISALSAWPTEKNGFAALIYTAVSSRA